MADVAKMIALNTDEEVVRYTGDSAFKNEESAKEVVIQLIHQFSDKKMGRLVVENKATQEWLGWCGLKWHEDEQISDLGYRFFKRFWGSGFATEASHACLEYGFTNLGFSKIAAHAQLENYRSVRVLEKLKFKRTGPTVCGGLKAEGFLLLRGGYFAGESRI